MNIEQALAWAKAELLNALEAGLGNLLPYQAEDALLDARALLCHVLDCNQSYLFTWPDKALSGQQQAEFESCVLARCSGKPVAHIVGYREFWQLPLKVSAATLIPRPDTECLVEAALDLALPQSAKVLDLGTGTGAIALALATERSDWNILATDQSEDAVALAIENRNALALNALRLQQSNWFDALTPEQFDLIISNPPYVEDNSPFLLEGDVRFEPASALTSGHDGLDDIRRIVSESPAWLRPHGYLMVEHGYQQGIAVAKMFSENGFDDVRTGQDFAQLDRYTVGKLR